MTKKSISILSSFIFFLMLVLISTSCHHQPNEPTNTATTVCFEKEVLPIILSNCAKPGCHAGTGEHTRLVMDDYNSIVKEVTPGDARNSRLYQAITRTWTSPMPPKPLGNIPLASRTIIALWIEQGAKDTNCP